MAMKVALAGIGKIARDQHVPALMASPDWELAATISRHGTVEGVESFTDIDAFLAARPDVEVVSLCMPPQPRYPYAEACLRAGRHVMLEKPPGQTLAEVHALMRLAEAQGLTLFATWHSRMAKGVAGAKAWLQGKTVTGGRITWREDVRKWHPGQEWVWEPGGLGVFDPGINALSVLTEILPEPTHLVAADLDVPSGRDTPIAARLTFADGITADFDWRQEGPQTWDIDIDTPQGRLSLREGGGRLFADGIEAQGSLGDEYPALYAQMAALVRDGRSDVDLAPMVHVADAFSLGRRHGVAAFAF